VNSIKIILSNVVIRACLVSGIFLWALTATIYGLNKESKTVLIGVDQNGTRVIRNQEDPLLKTEIVAFLRHFSLLMYNFDQNSYLKNVGAASELMSQNLWLELEGALKDKLKTVKEYQISHSAFVEQIKRTDPSKYEVVVRGFEQRKINRVERLFKVELSLLKSERNEINPWGIEVDGLKEIPLD
jgi:hypothetical protein